LAVGVVVCAEAGPTAPPSRHTTTKDAPAISEPSPEDLIKASWFWGNHEALLRKTGQVQRDAISLDSLCIAGANRETATKKLPVNKVVIA
jgi:hypothetical protein